MFGRHQARTKDTDAPYDTRQDEVSEPRRTDHDTSTPHRATATDADADYQRERFGGVNWGAAFFGWLVAVGITVLLASIAGAVAAAIGRESNLSTEQLADNAGTTGLSAAIALVVLLAVAYYTGGYVAGRMSRFDGGRQGFATWLIGLLVTVLAVGAGVFFGSEYNVLERVNLPSLSVPTEQVGMGGAITAAAVLLLTLLAAIAGGKVGRGYHRKVDRAAYE